MSPDALSKLDNDYQILTELHSSGDARTYLARHRTLNRDVTITVITATGDTSHLSAFAADAEILKNQRHPNVVPVIEGRWLADDTFAVVRARVRGSTLDQTLSAVGAIPAPRIAAALREIAGALAWARGAGVAHRHLSTDSVVFQQGPGRVLLAFDPSRVVSDDASTIRELAAAMNGGSPMNVAEYTAMLDPGAPLPPPPPARPTPRPAPPVVERQVPVASSRDDAIVVVQRKGMGFGARVLTAFAVVAVLVTAAVLFTQRRAGDAHRTTANGVIPDTQGDAAGDVALRSSRIDTAVVAEPVYPTPRIIEPTPTPTPPPPMPQQYVPAPMPQPMPMPMQSMSPVPRTASPPTIDTATRPPSGDICDSPSPSDQRRCLSSSIDRVDRELNGVYQKLIVALRHQASADDADPDPPSVDDLRAAQRRWLEERDQVCRGTGAGLLYARDRAACFSDRSATRRRELQQQLDALP